MAPAAACLAHWELHSQASLLAEQRRAGAHQPDFFARYRAEALGPAHAPVEAVRRFALAGAPVFAFAPDRSSIVVDVRFSSDLEVVDVPRLAVGAEVRVGRLTDAARAALDARAILELLVRADVVRTYWHLGSEVWLQREDASPGGYRAELDGTHTYFTSRRHRAPFAFAVEWAPDGEVVVTRRS
ncbi:MAG: hypothetical protein IT373_01565 [Polyangiaceae bacterium]|nr:hypothetical protein [Polyangiaceae bacterium]